MGAFGETLRRMREEQGVSLTGVARQTHYDKGHLSRIENGQRPPTEHLARLCDDLLKARGELIAAAHMDAHAARDTQPWQTAELVSRIRAGAATPVALDVLSATINDLCCQYTYREASELRAEGQAWLRHIGGALRKPIGIRAHQELLVNAGWLALLVGCVEYDMGMRASAEATRTAALQLGIEAGATEIIGWAHEMSAWFALTQGRYMDVLTAAGAGQDADQSHSVVVQLIGQEAKAYARIGDLGNLRRALDRGRQRLGSFTRPGRPEHHFVVDPSKWDFYAMDAYRLAGDDRLAEEHAHEVISQGTSATGAEQSLMRIAEARLTLATVQARRGELEAAVQLGIAALSSSRQSLPSLLMVAGELDSELERHFPTEQATTGFRDVLRTLQPR